MDIKSYLITIELNLSPRARASLRDRAKEFNITEGDYINLLINSDLLREEAYIYESILEYDH